MFVPHIENNLYDIFKMSFRCSFLQNILHSYVYTIKTPHFKETQ